MKVDLSHSKDSKVTAIEKDLYGPTSVISIFKSRDRLSKDRTKSFFSMVQERGSYRSEDILQMEASKGRKQKVSVKSTENVP